MMPRQSLPKPLELVQAGAIARRFYLHGKSKNEIADEFGLSRFKVARILDRAVETGLVKIEIDLPAQLDAELSDRLRAAYGLHHAIVVQAADEPEEMLRDQLGEVTAALLSETVVVGDVIGIGWGRTLNATTAALQSMAKCTVVQLTGAVGNVGVAYESVETVRRVAEVCGGPAYPMYAPLVCDSAQTAEAIRRQPHVTAAFAQFDRLTKAVVAVGSWYPPNSQLRSALAEQDRQALDALHVRAEVCSMLLDDEGRPVAPEWTTRLIAISADQLRRVPEVIAVAGGVTKAAAIRAVLAAGLITSLVTNASAARILLEVAHA
jgi:DNA-binding transcriptional regulator LsrR (DeoR family)